MSILIAFLIVSILGLLLGFGLSVAEKKLSVEQDPKLVELQSIMPGANCGGCGYAGCAAYAEAVYNGEAKPGLCSPGGAELALRMGSIMGVDVEIKEKMVAFVHCDGNLDTTKTDYEYSGLSDCNAASLLQGGPMACKEGCLHLGSCISACPVAAISRSDNGKITVDKDKCIGCGSCVAVCPNNVIRLVPYSAEYIVACNNHLPGGKVKKVCQSGCIGCRLCEIKVDGSPFHIDSFLSSNDYSKNQDAGSKAMEICPQKCIKKV